jgi:hypothetical protein
MVAVVAPVPLVLTLVMETGTGGGGVTVLLPPPHPTTKPTSPTIRLVIVTRRLREPKYILWLLLSELENVGVFTRIIHNSEHV